MAYTEFQDAVQYMLERTRFIPNKDFQTDLEQRLLIFCIAQGYDDPALTISRAVYDPRKTGVKTVSHTGEEYTSKKLEEVIQSIEDKHLKTTLLRGFFVAMQNRPENAPRAWTPPAKKTAKVVR